MTMKQCTTTTESHSPVVVKPGDVVKNKTTGRFYLVGAPPTSQPARRVRNTFLFALDDGEHIRIYNPGLHPSAWKKVNCCFKECEQVNCCFKEEEEITSWPR